MTWIEFIEELERKNPQLFAAERISITVDSFRAQLRRAYEAGHHQSRPSYPQDSDALKTLFGIFRR